MKLPAVFIAAVGTLVLSLSFSLGPAAAMEARLRTIAVDGAVAFVRLVAAADGGTVVIKDGRGVRHRLAMDGRGGHQLIRLAATPVSPPRLPDMLPDGHVTQGGRNIAAAWLTGPTDRYAHGALGDMIEASGLVVELKGGKRVSLRLKDDSVFEDLTPRLADLDGDGDDEVLVIRSYQDEGSALVLIEAGPDGLRVAAETPPHGLANRWLNPVGVADFDGDGRPEVALVRTPHIGGTLMLFELKNGALVKDHAVSGFSNHINGTRELGMSAVGDVNGDGVPDLLVPDAGRGSLRMVTFAGGRFAELARVPHRGDRIATAIVLSDLDGDGRAEAVYGLFGGALAVVSFSP